MRHVDERRAQLVLDTLELQLHLLAELHVERAERLVEQECRGAVHERAGEGHALLLTARQLRRLALVVPGKPDQVEHLADPAAPFVLRDLLELQAVRDVLAHRHVREQRVVLEAHVDLALVGRDADHICATQQDRPGVGLLEAGDHPHRRGLAAARRAEQGDELALGDLERDVVDGAHVPEGLRHALDADRGPVVHRHPSLVAAVATGRSGPSSSNTSATPSPNARSVRARRTSASVTTKADTISTTTATAGIWGSCRGSRS